MTTLSSTSSYTSFLGDQLVAFTPSPGEPPSSFLQRVKVTLLCLTHGYTMDEAQGMAAAYTYSQLYQVKYSLLVQKKINKVLLTAKDPALQLLDN